MNISVVLQLPNSQNEFFWWTSYRENYVGLIHISQLFIIFFFVLKLFISWIFFIIHNKFLAFTRRQRYCSHNTLPYAIASLILMSTLHIFLHKEFMARCSRWTWAPGKKHRYTSPTCNASFSIAQIIENMSVCVCVWVTGVSQQIQCQSHCVCSSVDMAYFAWQPTSHTSQGLHNNTPCRGDSLIGFLKESLACICILIDEWFFSLSPLLPWLSPFFNSH